MGSNSRNLEAQQTSFKKIPTSDDWFEVREIAENLFFFCEPRHYENTIVNLVVGEEKAALIDTGCGIGNLRSAIEDVTDKPIVVINTHTHADHLGGNYQFDEIAMFDHPLSRRVAESGVSHQILSTEILAENLSQGLGLGISTGTLLRSPHSGLPTGSERATPLILVAANCRRFTHLARRRITFAYWIARSAYCSAATSCCGGRCGRIWTVAVCRT
jgi:hypothetical protein